MENIPFPDQEIVPIEAIAEGVRGLRIGFVNVFGVEAADGSWYLIDAGLPFAAGRIRRWAQEKFAARPAAILLTHGHFDHVGAIESLLKEWNVPVYVHTREMPFVTGQEKYPPPDPTVGGGLMALMSPFYSRGPIDISEHVTAFGPEGALPMLPDWRLIETPGHTPGHVSFFRETDRTLIAGDAFCTVQAESLMKIATQKAEFHGPPAYYTPDWDNAKASVQRLADLNILTAAAGHGAPVSGLDVAPMLRELATNFDEIARPKVAK